MTGPLWTSHDKTERVRCKRVCAQPPAPPSFVRALCARSLFGLYIARRVEETLGFYLLRVVHDESQRHRARRMLRAAISLPVGTLGEYSSPVNCTWLQPISHNAKSVVDWLGLW